MAGENTQSTFDAYKERYAEGGPNNVVPNSSILKRLIKLDGDLTGDSYHQAVTLTLEHGFTYGGSGGGVSSLAAQVNATVKDANSTGYSLTGRARVGYTAASRAASSAQSFGKLWDQVLLNLKLGHEKRSELGLLYGQQGLGVVSGNSSGVLTITAASWSPTTWAGMEGAILEAWTGVTASETQHNGDLTISAVDFVNGTVTVTGTNAAVVANDVLYLKGARTASAFNEGAGLIKIAGNTSGTLFGISATTYGLWAGNTKASFATPSMGKFLAEITQAVDKGLEEKVILLVCPKTWELLNADLAAQRQFDGSYSKEKAENGAQKISYYGQAGEIEVRTHPYLRRGDAVAFPLSPYKRVGSADVGMGVPGLPDANNIFFHDTSTDAMEARTFSDFSLFCNRPSTSVAISGITYP
jgi:hypothetical protein